VVGLRCVLKMDDKRLLIMSYEIRLSVVTVVMANYISVDVKILHIIIQNL
jgi:hypothetical protein